MHDVTISYAGSQIASMEGSGVKTLLTSGKYCEDDIFVSYNKTGNATAEGDSSISVNDAESGNICSLIQYGVCEQDAQTNAISCNNGTLSVSSGEIVTTAANREAIALGSQTATVENLYSVGNVRDEQELVTGTVTRKNAACIYDGTQPVGDRYISSTGAKDNGAIIIYPLETEHTGDSIVSFTETVKQDVNSLEARIEPRQDLHGYSNPWPGGGGANKFGVSDASNISTGTNKQLSVSGELMTVSASGTVSSSAIVTSAALSSVIRNASIPDGTYYFNVWDFETDVSGATVSNIRLNVSDNGTTVAVAPGSSITVTNGTFLSVASSSSLNWSNGKYISFRFSVTPTNVEEWTPYENICPISGRTGLNVYRTGFNLCQDSVHINHFWESGVLKTNKNANYAAIDIKIPVVPGEDYCVYVPDNTGGSMYFSEFDESESYLGIQHASISSSNFVVFTATDGTRFIAIGFYKSGGVSAGERICVSLSGANDGTYEPYQGTTYAVDWTSQAGTVYGGTLDVVTGMLTVDRAIVDLGTLTWRTLSEHKFYATTTGVVVYKPYTPQMLCDTYKFAGVRSASPWYGDENELTCYYVGTSTVRELYINDPAYTDVTEFKAAMSGVQLCYELATPLTYQLTPQEVVTLVGANNIFSPDATSIKVAVSNPVIEYVDPQPLTLAEGSNTVSATNLSVSSVPLELNYIPKAVEAVRLLAEDEVTVTTTSTSVTNIKTITVTPTDHHSVLLFIEIRDKAGPRNGYFYGSTAIWSGTSERETTNNYRHGTQVLVTNSSGLVKATSMSQYGVCGNVTQRKSNPYSTVISIMSRYNSSYSGTIDGTYSIKIYEVAWPCGTPFS